MKTDAQLQQDIIAELKWEPAVDATQIGVEVVGGVATLSGSVESYAQKWNAQRAAQRVFGLQALAMELKVNLSAYAQRTDADIARSATEVLGWTGSVPTDSVKVLVEDGWVTLSGEVPWQYQRQDAAHAVRFLAGVTGLSNQIGIRAAVSADGVKDQVEAALKRRAISDAQNIHVNVQGTDVTLTGTVHSWAERELATRSAWGTAGVGNVVDQLPVTN